MDIVIKKLLIDYIFKKKWMLFGFFLVVLLTLPVEAVILPQLYSRLFNNISNNLEIKHIIYVIIIVWVLIVNLVSN